VAASGGKWNRYQKAYISPVNHARMHQLRIREESSFEGNSRAQPGCPRLQHRLGGLKFRQRFPLSGINFGGERSREMSEDDDDGTAEYSEISLLLSRF
jgi:hypothetical protein